MTDTQPSSPKSLLQFKVKKSVRPAAAPETLQDRVDTAFGGGQSSEGASAGAGAGAGGAAEAAGVLTAIDEDGEGVEEADVPGEFEYLTDGEGGED